MSKKKRAEIANLPSKLGLNVMPDDTLEMAGIEFIDENGGGPGVRLAVRPPGRPRGRK